jgi:hypothetical protein
MASFATEKYSPHPCIQEHEHYSLQDLLTYLDKMAEISKRRYRFEVRLPDPTRTLVIETSCVEDLLLEIDDLCEVDGYSYFLGIYLTAFEKEIHGSPLPLPSFHNFVGWLITKIEDRQSPFYVKLLE